MDITRWSISKSDWLHSLQLKMDKLYTIYKNKIRSWLWLRSWAPYCKFRLKLKKVPKNFSYHSWFLKARILKWFALPFSSGPRFVRSLHHDPSVLGGPTRHGSEFHWVRQGCGPCDQFDQFSVTVFSILSALWWIRIRGLWNLPDGRDCLWGNLGLALLGRAMLSKSSIQFSVD